MIPGTLQNAIAQSRSVLEANPLGHLPLPNRKSIWREFGPTMVKVVPPVAEGILRRGALAFLTVTQSLPVWHSTLNTRDVEEGLRAVPRFARQEIGREEAFQTLQNLWSTMEKVLARGEKFFRASYVAAAASSAIDTIINDADYPKNSDESQEQDEDRDPYEWDASLYSCMALTDDVWADPPVYVEERRSFWMWYIGEAIPEAYENFRAILGL
jgi:hypothetical protein